MLSSSDLVQVLEQYEYFLIDYAVTLLRQLGNSYPTFESKLMSIIKGTAFPVPVEVLSRLIHTLTDPEIQKRQASNAIIERFNYHINLVDNVILNLSTEIAFRPLLQILEKKDVNESFLSTVTLAYKGYSPAKENLLIEFEKWLPSSRWATTIILGSSVQSEWYNFFIQILNDPEPDVLKEAIKAISKFKTNLAASKLLELTRSNIESVAITAIQCLSEFRDSTHLQNLIDLFSITQSRKIKATIMTACGEYPISKAYELLLKGLKDDDSRTRANAALGLRKWVINTNSKHSETVSELAKLLSDHDHRVKADVVLALWELGSKDGLTVIDSMLKSPIEPERVSAAYLCGKLNLMQFTDTLAALTDDKSWNVRKTAALSLLSFGDKGLLVLKHLSIHGTPDQQVAASYALGLADDIETVNTLLKQSNSGFEMSILATERMLRV